MNTANALGFFLLGTVMQALPLMSASPAYDSGTTQTMWLQLMGLVTGGIGGGYLLRMGVAEATAGWSRIAWRRAEAREQASQGAQQTMPLGGVRVTF
jgi:hypothetical protein